MVRSLPRQGHPCRGSDTPCAHGPKIGMTGERAAQRSTRCRALLLQAQAVPGHRHALRQDAAQRPGQRPSRRLGDPPQLRTRPSGRGPRVVNGGIRVADAQRSGAPLTERGACYHEDKGSAPGPLPACGIFGFGWRIAARSPHAPAVPILAATNALGRTERPPGYPAACPSSQATTARQDETDERGTRGGQCPERLRRAPHQHLPPAPAAGCHHPPMRT